MIQGMRALRCTYPMRKYAVLWSRRDWCSQQAVGRVLPVQTEGFVFQLRSSLPSSPGPWNACRMVLRSSRFSMNSPMRLLSVLLPKWLTCCSRLPSTRPHDDDMRAAQNPLSRQMSHIKKSFLSCRLPTFHQQVAEALRTVYVPSQLTAPSTYCNAGPFRDVHSAQLD